MMRQLDFQSLVPWMLGSWPARLTARMLLWAA